MEEFDVDEWSDDEIEEEGQPSTEVTYDSYRFACYPTTRSVFSVSFIDDGIASVFA